jgi:hypothetical protein
MEMDWAIFGTSLAGMVYVQRIQGNQNITSIGNMGSLDSQELYFI